MTLLSHVLIYTLRMTTLLKIIERTATRWGLGILFFLYVLVFGAIQITMNKLAVVTGGFSILDFDFGYSEERVLEVLGSYGEEGMALYGRIQLLDILNPAIYSLFFASILYLLFKKGGFTWVVILPLLAGALDYAENITLYILSSSYPDISGTIVSLSSSLSIVKNTALYSAIGTLVIGFVLWARSMTSIVNA